MSEYSVSLPTPCETVADVARAIRAGGPAIVHREDGTSVVIALESLDDYDRVFVRYSGSRVPASITVGDARRNRTKFPPA